MDDHFHEFDQRVAAFKEAMHRVHCSAINLDTLGPTLQGGGAWNHAHQAYMTELTAALDAYTRLHQELSDVFGHASRHLVLSNPPPPPPSLPTTQPRWVSSSASSSAEVRLR